MKKRPKKLIPRKELVKPHKKFNWKLALKIAVSFVIIFSIYQIALYYEFRLIMPIYLGITLVLCVVFVILNKGFDRNSPLPEQLCEDWSMEQKMEYIAKDEKQKRIARKLLILLIPFLFTFAFDIIYLFYLDPLVGK